MTTQTSTNTTRLILPPELRLPDLSQVRAVTLEDTRRWLGMGVAAYEWGPDERNGCRRDQLHRSTTGWVNGNGQLHGPDEWTPAVANVGETLWIDNDSADRNDDQPSSIEEGTVTWSWRSVPHRAHAPAQFHIDGTHGWSYRRRGPSQALVDLLDNAWSNLSLTGQEARAILAAGERISDWDQPTVAPQVWLAHVIAANPSPNLDEATRAWAGLLAI